MRVLLFSLISSVVCAADAPSLVFVSDRGGDNVIWRMGADGTDPVQLTSSPPSAMGDQIPDVSWNGKEIAFTTYRFGGWKIATMGADGRNIRRVANNPSGSVYEWSPTWSPNGKQFLFVRFRANPGIYLANRDGSNQVRLTDNSGDRYQEKTEQPRWLPDGRHFLYVKKVNGAYDVFSRALKGGEARNITNNRYYEISPSVSPDGRLLTFYSNRDGVFDLYVCDMSGKNVRRLIQHTGNPKKYVPQESIYQLSASWSPDGKHIAHVGLKDGRLQIFVVDMDGGVKQLTSKGNNTSPKWTTQ